MMLLPVVKGWDVGLELAGDVALEAADDLFLDLPSLVRRGTCSGFGVRGSDIVRTITMPR
jgi:hypothetical protein